MKSAIRSYEIVCLLSLAALIVLLLQRGVGVFVVPPIILGIAGLLGRGRVRGRPLVFWRAAPLGLILSLAFLSELPLLDLSRTRFVSAQADVLLTAALLGYVIGHYRLQGLELTPLPADPRQVSPAASRRAVPAGEIIGVALEVVIWTILAYFTAELLPERWDYLNLDPALWRIVLLLWTLGVGILVVSGILGYLSHLRMSPGEAELLLQDVFWGETRREQRRLGRWSAWLERRSASKEPS